MTKSMSLFALVGFAFAVPLSVSANETQELIMLDVSVSAERCYVGQPIALTATWSAAPPLGLFKAVDIRVPVMADRAFKIYDSHKTEDLPDSKSLGVPMGGTRAIANRGTVQHGSNTYATLTMRKVMLPMVAGTHVLEPARMTCALKREGAKAVTARGGTKGAGNLYQYPLFFDNSFFDKNVSSSDRVLSAVSASNIVTVMPLPPGAPAAFSGLTGQYRFSVSLSTNVVRQGDPLALNLAVSGSGYLAHVKIPPLDIYPGFTNQFRVASDRRLQRIDAERIVFTQTVYPRHSGEQEFPALSLCVFDPDNEKYETVNASPLPLMVEESHVIDGSVLGLVRDADKTAINPLRWVSALLGLGMLGAVVYVLKRLRARPLTVESMDRVAAYQQFRDTLALLKETDFETPREQYDALNGAVSDYVAAHLSDCRPRAITFRDVDMLLHERQADEALKHTARALFREMDLCRFSPAGPTVDYASVLSQARVLVDALR